MREKPLQEIVVFLEFPSLFLSSIKKKRGKEKVEFGHSFPFFDSFP